MKRVKRWAALMLMIALFVPCTVINLNADIMRVDAASMEVEVLCFDAIFYAEQYPDLKASYGYDESRLYNHYMNFGLAEGRAGSPILDPRYYLENNSDIGPVFGYRYEDAYKHFTEFGYKEYRKSSPYFSGSFYKDRYKSEFQSFDSLELLNHFKRFGLNEGRRANDRRYEGKSSWRSLPVPPDPWKDPTPITIVVPDPGPIVGPTTPVLKVSPSRLSASANGSFSGSSAIQVNTENTGGFQVSTNGSSWLRLGQNSSYGTTGTLSYASAGTFYVFAQSNASTSPRTGTITVTHSKDSSYRQSITVTQEGKKITPYLTVSSTRLSASAEGTVNPSSVQVRTNNTGGFRVNVSGANWLTVGKSSAKSSASGSLSYTDSGSFYVFADANNAASSRTGTIIVTHADDSSYRESITVTQESKKIDLTVSSRQLNASTEGTVNPSSVQVSTNNTGGFRVDVSAAWLTVGKGSAKSSGSGSLSYTDSGSFYVFAGANNSTSPRTGTITVTHAGDSSRRESITVTQEGKKEEYLKASSTQLSASAEGTMNPSSVQVSTNNTGGFHVNVSGANWLTVGKSSAKGSASGSLSYTDSGSFYVFADTNTSASPRTGTITVTHADNRLKSESITVTQEGKKVSTEQLTVNVNELSLPEAGTASNGRAVKVETQKTGGFTAEVSSAAGSWLSVSRQQNAGSGSSKLTYNDGGTFYIIAAANNTSSKRTGKITVTHAKGSKKESITVTQDGNGKNDSSAVLEADEEQLAVPTGGTASNPKTIQVNTKNTGGFTAEVSSAASSWLSIGKKSTASGSSKLSYTGNGTFYVMADANNTSSERTGKITITHAKEKSLKKTVSITQSPKSGNESDDPKPGNEPDDPKSGQESDDPKPGNESDDPAGGSQPQNPSDDNQNGQESDDPKPGDGWISSDITEITANANGIMSVSSITVDTQGTGGFTASAGGGSWLKVGKSDKKSKASAKISYDEGGTVYVFVEKYSGKESRTGTITLKHENGTSQTEVTVVQSGSSSSLTVDAEKKTVDKNGSFYNNAVSVKAGKTASYTVEAVDCDWLGITSEDTQDFDMGLQKMAFTGSQTFYLVAAENTGMKRTAVVRITQESGNQQKEITVTQIGMDSAYLEIDRETAYFDEPGAAVNGPVHVMADDDTKWTAEASEKWIKIADSDQASAKKSASMEGTGSGTFYISADKNNAFQKRSGYVTVSAPGMGSCQIYVSQAENERDMGVLLEELSVRVTRKTFNKGKTSQIKLTFPEGLYASDVKKVSYTSNKKKVATVDKNGKVKAIRKGSAKITVKVELDNGASKKFILKVNVGKRTVKLTEKK